MIVDTIVIMVRMIILMTVQTGFIVFSLYLSCMSFCHTGAELKMVVVKLNKSDSAVLGFPYHSGNIHR